MAKRSKKAEEKGKEFYENPEVLAEQLSRGERFLEENKTIVYAVVSVVVLLVAGVFGYRYYVSNQNDLAQVEMFQAVYYFESDSLNRALNGDGNSYGFLDIIDNFSGTDAANLANFYAGASYLKQGQYETAIDYLEDFDSDDLVIQARAYSLIGDAYMELGNYTYAAEQYEKAANHNPNKFFSPTYLKKAALAYEKQTDYKSALECYDEIVEKYHDSSEVLEAKKHKSRLEGMLS